MKIKKKILILSPQPWDHIYISKHHYALEFAKKHRVWFISAPEKKIEGRESKHLVKNSNVELIKYKFWMHDFFKFHMPAFYKKVLSSRLKKIIKAQIGAVDICIDFGCYQLFDKVDFVDTKNKIYFPVDDNENLKLSNRGCDKIYSVSKNVLQKLKTANIAGQFIDHGLSDAFAQRAKKRMTNLFAVEYNPTKKITIGYAGNLCIPFLDIQVFKKIIAENKHVEFVFFGSSRFDKGNLDCEMWIKFLLESENVKLMGNLSPQELADKYEGIDCFILCYKPDYKNYHGENSHKVLEYMSTGKVIVSTYLSVYNNCSIINMSPKDSNELLIDVFSKTISDISHFNNAAFQSARIEYALNNTYEKHVEKIVDECMFM